MITWITGNSGSGKTTLAETYRKPGVIILDGDDLRSVWEGLGFSLQDRWDQNLRAARLAKLLESQGYEVVVATICPYKLLREKVKRITNCQFIYLPGGKSGPDYPYEL